LLVYDYRVALTIFVVFWSGYLVTRRSLFPAMFAYLCLPLADGWFQRDGLAATLLTVLAAMILIAHRKNLFEETAALLARRDLSSKPERTEL
jgi:glycerol-3-phosphate acyltransferase PlsY